MAKNIHEIRDPIHVFIRLDSHERGVLDSTPFQRLRHIHQLALTYLVYPGATHRRFEHSLGVMELADRVFGIITDPDNIDNHARDMLPEITRKDDLAYWRRVLRMAALCHDIGHLPFSHAAEKELLPENWSHERLTRDLILSSEMKKIWERVTPPLRPEDIVKLAIGPKEASDLPFSDWETILAEVIVGDTFGVDRMDYLLRDSHHAGVAYGRFDHYRLIDSLRILRNLTTDKGSEVSTRETTLGIHEGGLQSSEALRLARYFMYKQVYFHPVRRIYDIHLKDFLTSWLPNGVFSTKLDDHVQLTDNEITAALLEKARIPTDKSYLHACRIVKHDHFKVLYERNPGDVKTNPEAGKLVFDAFCSRFGQEKARRDRYPESGSPPDFPVLLRDDSIESSLALSETLQRLPVVSVDYVFVDREILSEAQKWLKSERISIIKPVEEE